MDSSEEPFLDSSQPSVVSKFFKTLSQVRHPFITTVCRQLTHLFDPKRYQSLLDAWTPHLTYRWVSPQLSSMPTIISEFVDNFE